MGRALVSAHIQTHQYSIAFGTVHFESGVEDWSCRQEKLQIVTGVLKADIPILVGDFNVYDDVLETEFITSLGWKDVWLKPLDLPEYRTERDIERNGCTFGPYGWIHTKESVRLDRILYQTNTRPIQFSTFGDYTLDIPDFKVFPSDHLGIHCVFQLL